ncbi:MAG: aminoacyl-tRNA hydrolase [Lachnospiraceae bacterium]|jgi:PTH1 family peptidyl-tRNA hydrolase|nr:aminoacyl-tRNA hydrolase [Lachnospiraceae bacterium]
MYIIAGLGNPTMKYEHTRHNTGFDAIEICSKEWGIPVNTMKFRAYIGKGMVNGNKVMLVKPQTYMNNSGESIGALVDYFGVDPENELIIVYDDISLSTGQLRIRKKGSAGGHNGIKSIISHLGTNKFLRIKVGVGENKGDLVNFVLGHFDKNDGELMKKAFEDTKKALELMVSGEVDKAMNIYNTKKQEEKDEEK